MSADEAPSASLAALGPLFEGLDAQLEESVHSATVDGMRLGIGLGAQYADAALDVATSQGAHPDALYWLRLVADAIRKASASV